MGSNPAEFEKTQSPSGLIARRAIPAALGALMLSLSADIRRAKAQGIKIIDNPKPPVIANGRTSIPWGALSWQAGVGYTVSDDGGIADSFGHVMRGLGRTDKDPKVQLRAQAAALAHSPDIASTGFCPGAAKFALAGPLIEGGIELFGRFINEFNRKGVGAIAYSANGLRQLEDGSLVDFGSRDNPITPKEFHTLVRDITELGIPFAVNTKTQRYGLPWWRAAYEVEYSRTRYGTINGVVRTGEYLSPGQIGFHPYAALSFEYRLNTEDPNDSGTWVRGNERIWAGFQVSQDVNAITANQKLASTRNYGDMDAAGLIIGTKKLA